MKNIPLGLHVVPHRDGALDHHIEVGPCPSNFRFSSVLGPFLRADEELGCHRELVYIYEIDIVSLPVLSYRSSMMVPITWGLMIPLNYVLYLRYIYDDIRCRVQSGDWLSEWNLNTR